MKLFSVSIVITRDGYVKTEDELVKHQEDANAIVEAHLAALAAELDQAGYRIETESPFSL